MAPDGSVYVADDLNHRIQKFTPDGVFVTEWGTQGTGDGQFYSVYDVSVATDGSVYVADSGTWSSLENNRVQKFTPDGVFVRKWGTYGTDDGQFDQLRGITVASDGSVYCLDYNNNRIQRFTSEGVFVSKWDIDQRENIAVSSDGIIYLASTNGHNVRYYSVVP